MKKILKNVLEILFLFHRFRLQTKLTREEILKRAERFVIENEEDYKGHNKKDGFTIVKRYYKSFIFGYCRNSFAPVAVAKIEEANGVTDVSCTLRMSMAVQIPFVPVYLSLFFCVFVKPVFALVFLALFHCAFFHPAIRLKKALIALLTEN